MLDSSRQASCFSFSGHHYDAQNGVATLSYDADGVELKETIAFPWAPWPVDASRQAAFFRALELLHLIAGVSYYKAGLARQIDTGPCRLDDSTAGFLNTLYEQGLGEFAYFNDIDLAGVIRFESNTDDMGVAPSLDLPERALVAMGGGKDSLVCQDILRRADIEVQPICVGGSSLIGDTVKASGLPLIRVKRTLAAGLKQLNEAGAWNGHVPVTAINSAILLCAALLYGYRYVVFANESSANEATLTNQRGEEVNHQYSKSYAFESAFRDVISRRVSDDIDYFSLLRPFSETAITSRFAKMKEMHSVFSSCNRNFHLDGSHIDGRWCQDCPKCRFTALALAPFMTPQQLLVIQGAELLDQQEQLEGFKSLCGIGSEKPFECVGSIAESRAAVKFLASTPEWKQKFVISSLAGLPEIRDGGELELEPDFSLDHCIPARILGRIHAF